MFLPIGDSPNLPRTPWLTWFLIAANVAVHLALWPLSLEAAGREDPVLVEYVAVLAAERGAVPAQVTRADLVRFEHGFKPSRMELSDALSSMFLHGGIAHLLGNMLFLWIFGDNVEHRLGRGRFLLAYLGTGLAAAMGDALLRWDSGIPSVGASGAISGVLGLYFAWFPHNRVRVFVFLFPFIMETIELSARFVLGMYLVLDNLLPLLLSGGAGGISYGAHIGGFAAGWAGARWLEARGEHPRVGPAGSQPRIRGVEPRSAPEPPRLDRVFREALAAGRLAEAASYLFELPRAQTRHGLSARDKIELGEALEAAGEERASLATFQRALGDHPRGPGRPRAHLGAARVMLHSLGSPTAAYQHLYAAMEEDPSPAEEAAARRILAEIGQGARTLPRQRPW